MRGVLPLDVTSALRLIDKIDMAMAVRISGQLTSPVVFETLDDMNASREAIELIGPKISDEIRLRLSSIAGSVYLGSLRRGHIASFYDIVSCLGMARTKALILLLSNSHHDRQDPELEVIFAESYATSVMAMILAGQMGFREEAVIQAEICGLFMNIGKKFMILYRKTDGAETETLTEEFIDAYHPYLGEKIVKRYGLPDYIKQVILARNLILEENHVSLMGIVQMAHESVRSSFQKHDNRLILKCMVPRPATDVTRTLEAIVTEKFRAVGLEKYLHIIRIPNSHLS